MASGIHETAIVDPAAEIGCDVQVGPYSIVESGVVIGDGCVIGPHVLVATKTRLGSGCRVFKGASVGTIPQDLKFMGEETVLTVGDNTIIREFCTLNRGTKANWATVIGSNCALLAYCHVAHDCVLGDNVVASNGLAMAGHVKVGDNVTMGGGVSIHQFARVGEHAFIGANITILKDVIPFALCGGEQHNPRIVGINKVGLERKGFDADRRAKIKKIYRILFRDGFVMEKSLCTVEERFPDDDDARKIVAFVRDSGRGIYRMVT